MKFSLSFLAISLAALAQTASASVYLPYTATTVSDPRSFSAPLQRSQKKQADLRRLIRQNRSSPSTAMAIPGYGVTEQIFVGGFANFLSIYNLVITGRILLSWFPQAQGIGALQPVFAITDPYLNLFRGLIPPIFGLDLSPILAFFLLNVLSNATAAVGSDMSPEQLRKLRQQPSLAARSPAAFLSQRLNRRRESSLSLNL